MASKKNILDSFGWFLEKLKSNFVKKSGDTMTGPLTISKTEIKNNDAEPADKITVSLPKESGTLMIEPESVTKNYVYAGPSIANGKPEFRVLTNSDLPDDFVANNVTALTLTVSNLQQRVDGVTGEITNTSTHCDIQFPLESPNITIDLPSKDGTLALKSDITDILTSDNTFSGKNSFVSGWDATTGNEASSDYQFIIDCPIMESGSNNEYYSAIWFRDKNLTGNYVDKNTLCLFWNTNENCLSTYDRQTDKVFNLAKESYVDTESSNLTKQINSLNAKIIMKKETVTGLDSGYIFLTTPEGYTIMTAVNPNWANEYFVTGVSAYANGYTVLFFNKAVPKTVTFTVNSYWYKTS